MVRRHVALAAVLQRTLPVARPRCMAYRGARHPGRRGPGYRHRDRSRHSRSQLSRSRSATHAAPIPEMVDDRPDSSGHRARARARPEPRGRRHPALRRCARGPVAIASMPAGYGQPVNRFGVTGVGRFRLACKSRRRDGRWWSSQPRYQKAVMAAIPWAPAPQASASARSVIPPMAKTGRGISATRSRNPSQPRVAAPG